MRDCGFDVMAIHDWNGDKGHHTSPTANPTDWEESILPQHVIVPLGAYIQWMQEGRWVLVAANMDVSQ